jgi:hypothetical protein
VALNTIKQTVKQQTEFFMKITPFLKSNIIIDQTTNKLTTSVVIGTDGKR